MIHSGPTLAGMTYGPPLEKKRKVRKFTWFILLVNVLFLIWVIAAAASASGHANDCGGLDQATCDSARDTGTAIGVFLVVIFWAAVDVILGIIWLVTRRRDPVIVYAQPQQQQGPPPGWYRHPQNPQLVQWWDGSRYTGHTQVAR